MNNLRKEVIGRNVKRIGLGSSQQDFSPIKWSQYFDSEAQVTTDAGSFHIYKKGVSGPVVVCLHGGGYSGLTWALFAGEITNTIECQVTAIDLRGHGNTKSADDNDLSLDTLSNDVVQVFNHLFPDDQWPVILVGHSMGGAVAVHCSHVLSSVVGLCVIDVVEGTALDALSSMQSILRGRPNSFRSIQHAIQWCYKGGQTHNVEAAKVSMPGQIINIQTGNLAANECDMLELKNTEELSTSFIKETVAPILEEDEETNSSDCGKPPLPKSAKTEPSSADDNKYTWRINLSKTERFWSGWFKGLSQKFLDIRIPKLLLLANIHGLDTTLTVGQMQGKFQLQVLAKSGHAIHEDQPHNVAEIIGGYLVKQKIAHAKVDLMSPMPGC